MDCQNTCPDYPNVLARVAGHGKDRWLTNEWCVGGYDFVSLPTPLHQTTLHTYNNRTGLGQFAIGCFFKEVAVVLYRVVDGPVPVTLNLLNVPHAVLIASPNMATDVIIPQVDWVRKRPDR